MKSPRAILLLAWCTCVLYAYPGYMTTAGGDQLVDSRVGSFTDWAPPMMTELWRIVGYACSGPAGMLLLQLTLFLVASYCVLRRSFVPRAAAIVAALITLMPPVLATLGVIWPQPLHAALAVTVLALVRAECRWARWLAVPVSFVACGLGPGSAIAMLPILVGGPDERTFHRAWHRLAAVPVWAVIALAAAVTNAALIDARTHRDELALAMDDVVGIIDRAGTLPDAEIRIHLGSVPLAATTDLQKAAHATTAHPERFFATLPPADIPMVLEARSELMRAYPRAYLGTRAAAAVRVLGLRRPRSWRAAYTNFLGDKAQLDSLHHTASHSKVQRALVFVVRVGAKSFLGHPYVYALLLLLLLPFAVATRGLPLVLLTSGLASELAVIAHVGAGELRYSLWMIVSVLLTIPLLIAARSVRAARAPRA